MAPSAPRSQEEPSQPPWPGKQFRNQLAAAVRSINWSYAIFWSISTIRPGVLTWKDGFYNGEIKTRKISNSADLTADQLVLQRSDQLRELYESLLSGECFFAQAQPLLPGKCFANNAYVWLCNAQFADTKTFQRALLAKTVACIPFMGGVLELGTVDQVLENTDMVIRIGTSFWEIQFPTGSGPEEPSSSPSENETAEGDIALEDLDDNVDEAIISGEIVESLSDGNLERIAKEMDELYGLCEDKWWIMDDGSFEAAPAPDVDGILSSSYRPSCFMAWNRSSGTSAAWVAGESQKLLKKAMGGGAWTNDGGGGTLRAEESNVKGHVMSERRRREKLNEMFLILRSLVPSIHKVDKASILAETIAYLKELEQRIEELESSSRTLPWRPTEATDRRRHASSGSKRKAPEVGEANTEREQLDGRSNVVVTVSVMEKEVLVEVRCRWEALVMTRVFDALKTLDLDVLSVHSSTPDGLLTLKIRAQHAGSAAGAPGMIISEALQRAIGRR